MGRRNCKRQATKHKRQRWRKKHYLRKLRVQVRREVSNAA